MEVIQTEDPRFVRDLHSKALLNTDRVSLENFRQRKKMFVRQEDEWNSIKNKVEELNNLRWVFSKNYLTTRNYNKCQPT
mgnify:CR=1 FL=1